MSNDSPTNFDLFSTSDFADPQDVRQGFLLILETLREQHRREQSIINRFAQLNQQKDQRIEGLSSAIKAAMDQGSKQVTVLSEQLDTRDGVMMRAISRVEQRLIIVQSAGEATAARVTRLEHAGAMPSIQELTALRQEMQQVRSMQQEIDKREAVGRAKLEISAEELRRQLEEVKDDLTVTGQRHVSAILQKAADVETQAKAEAARFAKIKETEEEERRDKEKEQREEKRYYVRWVLGIVATLLTIVATGWIGYRFGVNKLPAPAPTVLPAR